MREQYLITAPMIHAVLKNEDTDPVIVSACVNGLIEQRIQLEKNQELAPWGLARLLEKRPELGEGYPDISRLSLALLRTHIIARNPEFQKQAQALPAVRQGDTIQWKNANRTGSEKGIELRRVTHQLFQDIQTRPEVTKLKLWQKHTTPEHTTVYYALPTGALAINNNAVLAIGVTILDGKQAEEETQRNYCDNNGMTYTPAAFLPPAHLQEEAPKCYNLMITTAITETLVYVSTMPFDGDTPPNSQNSEYPEPEEPEEPDSQIEREINIEEHKITAKLGAIGIQLLIEENFLPENHTPAIRETRVSPDKTKFEYDVMIPKTLGRTHNETYEEIHDGAVTVRDTRKPVRTDTAKSQKIDYLLSASFRSEDPEDKENARKALFTEASGCSQPFRRLMLRNPKTGSMFPPVTDVLTILGMLATDEHPHRFVKARDEQLKMHILAGIQWDHATRQIGSNLPSEKTERREIPIDRIQPATLQRLVENGLADKHVARETTLLRTGSPECLEGTTRYHIIPRGMLKYEQGQVILLAITVSGEIPWDKLRDSTFQRMGYFVERPEENTPEGENGMLVINAFNEHGKIMGFNLPVINGRLQNINQDACKLRLMVKRPKAKKEITGQNTLPALTHYEETETHAGEMLIALALQLFVHFRDNTPDSF